MPQLKQNDDGSLGIQGADLGSDGAFIPVCIEYNASSVDKVTFVADREYVVKSIRGRPVVAGTDSGTVIAEIVKMASAISPASGTVLHSGSINLKGTAYINQTLTVPKTSTAYIASGDAIGVNFTGDLLSAVGSITINLAPK